MRAIVKSFATMQELHAGFSSHRAHISSYMCKEIVYTWAAKLENSTAWPADWLRLSLSPWDSPQQHRRLVVVGEHYTRAIAAGQYPRKTRISACRPRPGSSRLPSSVPSRRSDRSHPQLHPPCFYAFSLRFISFFSSHFYFFPKIVPTSWILEIILRFSNLQNVTVFHFG